MNKSIQITRKIKCARKTLHEREKSASMTEREGKREKAREKVQESKKE